MNNFHASSEKNPKGAGRLPTPPERQCKLGRFMVNIPPIRIPQLQRVVEKQGLPMSEFLRNTVLNRLDELDRAA